jgi:hypothetical protein
MKCWLHSAAPMARGWHVVGGRGPRDPCEAKPKNQGWIFELDTNYIGWWMRIDQSVPLFPGFLYLLKLL